ncbi:MAG: ExbD/TolR family protein [Polyangiales bacterium]
MSASMAKFKQELRKQIRRKHTEHEAMFLNITAMMDMMTIILVFLLKSLSASSANLPQSNDLALPTTILQSEASQEGIQVVVSQSKVLVNGNELKGVTVPGCFTQTSEAPGANEAYKLVFCSGDSKAGFAPKFKSRGTAADLEITPLLSAMDNPVRVAEEVSKMKPENNGKPLVEAMVVFDRYTSFRVMTEVMFTLGQAKVAKFHFVSLSQAKK